MFFYYHPESDSLWSQEEPLDYNDGLVEELTETEYRTKLMEIQNFDATNIPPQQMGDRHPVGTFPFQISNTYGQQNKNTPGGQFVVEFTTPVGMVANRYNLWNQSPQAVEIAQKELSALCHAVGVFKLSFVGVGEKDYGRELRGARGVVKVDLQDATKPDGFVEVKKVFDSAGNEPGKTGGAAPAPQPQQQQPPGGGWGQQAPNQQPAQNNPPAANNGGWGGNQNQSPAPQQGWQPGPTQTPVQQQPQQGQAPQGGGVQQPPWAR